MEFTIIHNPRCSKSRQTMELLNSKGISPKVIEYLKDGIDGQFLKSTVTALGKRPKDIIRTKEEEFKALELDLENDQDVIDAIVAHPKILERPIVIKGKKAVVGRPPENVLDLL
ncbi:MAG: arsenate reductase (glutaredoxin) [Bacteriovoracaceae bacterium]|nr:arsenate reductase (glutaredoxin) [Bacteriovoracaceae bacterium]